jgi:hypothetical protein
MNNSKSPELRNRLGVGLITGLAGMAFAELIYILVPDTRALGLWGYAIAFLLGAVPAYWFLGQNSQPK